MSTHIYFFDCDGVIINSGADLASSVNETLKAFGYWTLSEEQVISFIGDGARNLLLRSLKASTKNKFNIESERRQKEFEEIFAWYLQYYTAHPVEKTILYAGIKELLRVLKEKGKYVVLITNKPASIARLILEKLEIYSYFDLIIGPDTKDENGNEIALKPSTQGFEFALRELNKRNKTAFTAKNAIMFGDSASDIIAGKNFGCKTVACRGGLGNKEKLLSEHADFCFSVASEIEKFIDILSKEDISDEDFALIKDYAMHNEVPIMQDEGSDFICEYIQSHDVKRILEIGTAIGYSAVRFAKLSPEIRVTSIEIDEERYAEALKNVEKNALTDRITLILGDALTEEITGSFDLIFIDAAKAQYQKFFEKFKENLAPNGVIVSDNLSFHGMVDDLSLTHNYSTKKLVKKIRKYRDFLKTNEEFETEFFDKGDGISVSRRKIGNS
mgnify:CR=1 FL=1